MVTKLLCTFLEREEISEKVKLLSETYSILFDRIFILYSNNTQEHILTYSVSSENLDKLPTNTITVHRKKETNTLYTINALNQVIYTLNNGVLDKSYPVPWERYRNSILLTKGPDLRVLHTKLFDIVDLKVAN
jgi:hypothetical protein